MIQDAQRGWLALPPRPGADVGVKPLPYLPIYEELLAPLRHDTFCLLELGVWKGDSLEMWRDAFEAATIVGLDLKAPDVALGPRVHVVSGDQSDRALMDNIRFKFAPEGFDVVIDDASHLGMLTARSLQALYQNHLKPGGLYVIEDWGTGYWSDWPDGAAPATVLSVTGLDTETKQQSVAAGSRFPSHDAGMVGVIKRLIDHIGWGDIASHGPDRVTDVLEIECMRVHHGLVILKKPASAFLAAPSGPA
jgi:hypothetical protein